MDILDTIFYHTLFLRFSLVTPHPKFLDGPKSTTELDLKVVDIFMINMYLKYMHFGGLFLDGVIVSTPPTLVIPYKFRHNIVIFFGEGATCHTMVGWIA